jgi:catechol 2,3-dioxygenase-like lactoylglutathione lyase family enzyme
MGVRDMDRAFRFWREALHYVPRASYDPTWNVLVPPGNGPGAHLALSLSETPLQKHPRLHLDLNPDGGDARSEVTRLLSLGASLVDWDLYPADREPDFVVLADPDGNRFCVMEVSKHV